MTNKNDKMFSPLNSLESVSAKPKQKEKDDGVLAICVPGWVKIEPPYHSLGEPQTIWQYRDLQKELFFCVCRFISADGKKQDLPMTYWKYKDGSGCWKWKGVPAPRPLYGLEKIGHWCGGKVLICEGEKATDAAQKIFDYYTTLTSPNGASAADKANWHSLLGIDIIIWPDNDDVGRKYAETVARLALEAHAKSVSIVQVPKNFPEKWDLADELPDGVSIDDLRRLAKEARPVTLPPDPLKGIVERAANDPGEAFKPEVIEALISLKQKDMPKFESLWAALKKANVRVGKLDKEIQKIEFDARDDDDNDADSHDPSQTDVLLQLAASANLFHTKDGIAYADVEVSDHTEIWAVRSKGFRLWLLQSYFESEKRAPNAESFNAALNTIEAQAFFNAPQHEIFLRATQHEGKIYIDLCNAKWQAIEVDTNGWRVIDKPPVRFRRAPGMSSLPIPLSSGSIDDLHEFINVKDEDDFVLTVSYVLDALRGKGPNPVLAVSGEQGSAKTTFAKCIKNIVDPNTTPLRTLPREERDLFIAANNGYVLAFDNVSGIPGWLSDAFCRLSTGGGFATRQLHTDQDEILFQAMRPLILNGIDDIITKPDLADRAILVTLEAIPEDKRKTENEVMGAFQNKLPGILGALLDGVSHGLKALPNTRLESLPRMADFALWISACEGAFWEPGTFMAAYTQNRADAVEDVLEADPVASAIMHLVDMGESWEGTANQLLQECNKIVGQDAQKNKYWPTNARGISNRLTRAATFLRKKGIDVQRWRDSKAERTRLIKITWAGQEKAENLSSEASVESGLSPESSSNFLSAIPVFTDKDRIGYDELH